LLLGWADPGRTGE